jgi:N-acyl homoserine lactone hydrolase
MKNRILSLSLIALAGCAASSQPAVRAELGVPRSSADLEAVIDQPGPIEVETVVSADWSVPLSGLLNLDNPIARSAGLKDRDEPIQLYFHVLHHPQRGVFFIDTGAERAIRDDPKHAKANGIWASFLHLERAVVHTSPADWLERSHQQLAGVLFTHLHFDHITGLPDIPRGTPLYAGPQETSWRQLANVVTKDMTDREFEGHDPVRELHFEKDPSGRFEGVLDLFGDGSLWAIWVPGHTPGSLAYVARTPAGPVLFTGDLCHTAFGWEHGVDPGAFTNDHEENRTQLQKLRAFAAEHPKMQVRLGHQPLG